MHLFLNSASSIRWRDGGVLIQLVLAMAVFVRYPGMLEWNVSLEMLARLFGSPMIGMIYAVVLGNSYETGEQILCTYDKSSNEYLLSSGHESPGFCN